MQAVAHYTMEGGASRSATRVFANCEGASTGSRVKMIKKRTYTHTNTSTRTYVYIWST